MTKEDKAIRYVEAIEQVKGLTECTREEGCMLGLRNPDYYQGKVDALNETISLLDTLELKKPEMQYHKDIENAYKVGFELGIKSKGE